MTKYKGDEIEILLNRLLAQWNQLYVSSKNFQRYIYLHVTIDEILVIEWYHIYIESFGYFNNNIQSYIFSHHLTFKWNVLHRKRGRSVYIIYVSPSELNVFRLLPLQGVPITPKSLSINSSTISRKSFKRRKHKNKTHTQSIQTKNREALSFNLRLNGIV